MSAKLTLVTMAAAVWASAGLAAAQGACCKDKEKTGGTGERAIEEVRMGGAEGLLRLVQAQPEIRTETRSVMINRTDDHEYKVEINGDDVKAWIDGERVPKRRVEVGDDRVVLRGPDGETVMEFQRTIGVTGAIAAPRRQIVVEGVQGDGPIVWGSGPGGAPEFFARAAPGPDGQPEGDHPPVMIGITMGALGEDADAYVLDTLAARDLGAEDVVVVMGVMDELPADKAGVREGDVIVRLEGKWGAGPERLRELLMKKKPGDKLEIMVLREGERKEIQLELAPYETAKLGAGPMLGYRSSQEFAPFSFEFGEKGEVQELIEKLHEHRAELGEDLHEQIQELLGRLHEQDFNQFRQLDEMPRFRVYRDQGQAPRALVTPRPPTVLSVPGADALRGQDDRLQRIEDRLVRLEERLDRLLNALENRERDR